MKRKYFRAWNKIEREMVDDIWIAPQYGWLVLSDNDALAERGRSPEDQWIFM